MMDKQKIIVGSLAGLALLLLGWMLLHHSPDNAVDHPDGYHYICRNPNCKHEFTLTASEFDDYVVKHPGQYIKCPKCGTDDAQRVGAKERPMARTR